MHVPQDSFEILNFASKQGQYKYIKYTLSTYSICPATIRKNFTRTPNASTRAWPDGTAIRTRLPRRSKQARSASERYVSGIKRVAARLVSSSVPASACELQLQVAVYRDTDRVLLPYDPAVSTACE